MRIGVICEGHADRAVITNIITGITGFDEVSILAIRPEYIFDETDKAFKAPKSFSTWSIVKQECESRNLIDNFLSFEGNDFVVIHLDTAEADEFGIKRPNKTDINYCEELRSQIIHQINTWFAEDISGQILYAIAIEEIDAWILTIYEKNDSTKSIRPKEKLSRILSKKGINSTSNYENYFSLSKPLSKPKEIRKGNFLLYNHSLNAFFEEIKIKVLPKVKE